MVVLNIKEWGYIWATQILTLLWSKMCSVHLELERSEPVLRRNMQPAPGCFRLSQQRCQTREQRSHIGAVELSNDSIHKYHFFWPCSLLDVSSLMRNRTWAACSGSSVSWPLTHQGIPNLPPSSERNPRGPRASLGAQQERIRLRCRRQEFHPWGGQIPWGRKWQLTPVSMPEESHGQSSLAGYSPWGQRRDTTGHELLQKTPGKSCPAEPSQPTDLWEIP